MKKLFTFKYFWLYLVLTWVFFNVSQIVIYAILYDFTDYQVSFGWVVVTLFPGYFMILYPVYLWYKKSPLGEQISIPLIKNDQTFKKYLLPVLAITAVSFVLEISAGYLVMDFLPDNDDGSFGDFITNEVTILPDLIIWIVLFCIVNSICEEYLFRGLAYKVLRLRYGFWPTTIFNTIFFIAFHPNPVAIPSYIIGNIIVCKVYDKTDSLIFPIIMHSLHNTILVLSIYYSFDPF